jgi:putative transposase
VARLARVVAIDVAHHVTQRGNRRQVIFTSDSERSVYMGLLRESAERHCLSVIGYCLMSNHVHLVVIPRKTESLASTFKATHGQYASYWNAAHHSSGHLWQGRFYSCPLDPAHLWEALRYTELNPVRAGMVPSAAQWKWSSAAVHCGAAEPDACLEMAPWRERWTPVSWQAFLGLGETEAELALIRQCTHTGRPFGTSDFVQSLEQTTQRKLAPRKGGRPGKPADDPKQDKIVFDP